MIRAFTKGPFTGRHISAILVLFFAVVIVVNVIMARAAISTFGGEVVENSYVASQNYNKWLAEAAREKALGWSAEATRRGDGRLAVRMAGVSAEGLAIKADARHPLGRLPDQFLTFHREGDAFVSDQVLPEERWQLRIEARSGDKLWRSEQEIR